MNTTNSKMHYKISRPLLWIGLVVLLSGCALNVTSVPSDESISRVGLEQGLSVGQSFVSQNAGLNGVEFYLVPEGDVQGEIHLHVRRAAASTEDILSTSLNATTIKEDGYYKFEFQPQSDSFRKYYYAYLEFVGEGNLWLETAPGDSYLDGALYVEHFPRDQQSIFSLNYHSGAALLDFGREILYWGALTAAGIFLFIIPGLAIVTLMSGKLRSMGWYARFVIGIGLSLCLYPILYLTSYLIGVQLGPILAWIPGVIGLIFLIWRAFSSLRSSSLRSRFKAWRQSEDLIPDLTTLFVTVLIIGSRFFITRVVDLPLWGDSLTHSLVSQLVVDNGGLFSSWAPYAQLESFTYHFGFHTHVAAFHWITQIPVPQSTLWMGQIINTLAVLSLYPLARRIGASKWSGLLAILIAGLVSNMPSFYTNWGRYTQLTGQAILPGIMMIGWWLTEQERVEVAPSLLLGALMGGIGLVHYRVLIFAIILILVLFIRQALKRKLRPLVVNLSVSTITGILIFLPWFSSLIGGKILGNALEHISTPANSVSIWIQQYNALGELTRYLPVYVWVLMIICGLWGLIRINKDAITLLSWWLLILLVANPQVIGLPGQGVLSNFAVFIALYIPASLLIGAAIGWLISINSVVQKLVPFVFVLLAVLGGLVRLDDLDPQGHSLGTRPDIHAFSWIETNLPNSTKFLANSFFAFGGTIRVGSDGGWWLPLLAGRETTLPPINYGTEKGPQPDYIAWQNDLLHQLEQSEIDHPRIVELLEERGVSHVYIGQRHGRVNYFGPDILDPEFLLQSSKYKPVYNQDRVWIFEVVP